MPWSPGPVGVKPAGRVRSTRAPPTEVQAAGGADGPVVPGPVAPGGGGGRWVRRGSARAPDHLPDQHGDGEDDRDRGQQPLRDQMLTGIRPGPPDAGEVPRRVPVRPLPIPADGRGSHQRAANRPTSGQLSLGAQPPAVGEQRVVVPVADVDRLLLQRARPGRGEPAREGAAAEQDVGHALALAAQEPGGDQGVHAAELVGQDQRAAGDDHHHAVADLPADAVHGGPVGGVQPHRLGLAGRRRPATGGRRRRRSPA